MTRGTTERRKHPRHVLACPVRLVRTDKQVLAHSKTMNVSDGGAMLTVPIRCVPPLQSRLGVQLSVPRTTANTYMLEEFSAPARVIRHQPVEDNELVAIAVQFASPLPLGLQV